ncbi:hypothetical protein C4K68_22305 [Pokkaliibacter plantistimulans]|uniref:diguanylate cyclase n=1 Tax=Proteobacteria bacterium 228 TaxID=2083153 RepID=A0A2S5KK42_9PROT|nr:GGDEF domain-containing protein [Pokkaliibacter plantistimulans]PPC75100.1 hypothetical protein C4K68_22305 [Pokkaliibacter plantistimulans]
MRYLWQLFVEMLKDRRQRMVLVTVLALALFCAMVAGTALKLVNEQNDILAQPKLLVKGGIWHLYRAYYELNDLPNTLEGVDSGQLDPYKLSIRLQVVASLLDIVHSLQKDAFATDEKGESQRTLLHMMDQINHWDQQASSSTPLSDSQLHQLTGDIRQQLPKLLHDINDLAGTANVSQASLIDSMRYHYRELFIQLAWAVGGLGIAGLTLVIYLLSYIFRERRLSDSLSEMNSFLELRVEERAHDVLEREERLKAILETSPSDVILIHPDGKVHFVNQRLLQRLNCTSYQSFSLDHFFADADAGRAFCRNLSSQQLIDEVEMRIGIRDPYWGVVSGRVLYIEQEPAYLIWSYDISQRKAMEQELVKLASTDTLTGLHNHHSFIQQSRCWLVNSAQPAFCALLMIDIDHFKQINDNYGHTIGDQAIQSVAHTLQAGLRKGEILGRINGEKFALLMPISTNEDIFSLMEALRQRIETHPMTIQDYTLYLTVSVGAAFYRPSMSIEELLERADTSLYQAKAMGRNRVAVWSD